MSAQKYAVYNGIHLGQFAVPEAVYDTPEAAADAARAFVLVNIDRIKSIGDPMACAVLVIPVPIWSPS